MMQSRTVEIWVGVFVALGLAGLFVLTMQVSNIAVLADDNGYEVQASFANASGLKERAPVTVAGVRIGRVSRIEFDPVTFEALVTLRINSQYDQLPADTGASIYTAGLLGERYIGLEPGGADENLQHGDRIMLTQSSIILEQLIGKFLFNQAAEGVGP